MTVGERENATPPSTAEAPPPRSHLGQVAVYAPGRSAEAAMAEHGIGAAVKLASNEVPFGPLPGVAEAVTASIGETHRYADHLAGSAAEAFANLFGVDRERVAVGPGSVGLLQQLALAFAGPGDEVVFPWPSFVAYPQFSGIVVADQMSVPLRRCSIDVDAVLGAITSRTKLVFIANPNNPLSGALRSADLRRLVDGVPPNCLLVIDEAYREFVTGADVPDALTFIDRPNVVVLRTLSKAYGMAGLRIGFMVGDRRVVAAVNATLIPFAVNGPAQAAALAALAQGDEVARRCRIITGERRRVARELRGAGLGIPDSQANFLWLPAGGRSAELTLALEKRGVVVRPFPTGVRVTVGTVDQNDTFLAALAAVRTDAPSLTDDWQLPTGEVAERTKTWLDRLDIEIGRLRDQAASASRLEPDEGARREWAEATAAGAMWLTRLNDLLDAGSNEPTPLVRIDAGNVTESGQQASTGVAAQLDRLERFADRLAALLAEMTVADWGRVVRHPALGDLTVDDQLDQLHIGPDEQRARHLAGQLGPR